LSLEQWVVVLAVLAGVVLTAYVTLWFRHRLEVLRLRRRFARGREGETRAVALLERHGYRVVGEQVTAQAALEVDGERCDVKVRADLLAERGGRQYVVEVKTGQVAPDPTTAATRRQLFEYHHVFRPDGILLADMERDVLLKVRFPVDDPLTASRGVGYVVAMVFLAGLATGWWLWGG
jgi:Holliday junction resolvase-like predicted endonuclease